jgi:hypothetical protein
MLRRRLFWILYLLSLAVFLMFFFGQYLLSWAESQTGEAAVTVGFVRTEPGRIIALLRDALKLNGSPETFRNFFWWQCSTVTIVLALAGSLVVGNDFQYGSLPFYLSKPLGRWHYVLGKCLAVAVFVNATTTLPALVLFVQYGVLDRWQYFVADGIALPLFGVMLWLPVNPLLLGILGYGLLLTVCLSLLLVATAIWLRRTVPILMAWTTLFVFLRLLSSALVDGLKADPNWRLLDLWNDAHLVGNVLLGISADAIRPQPQPNVTLAFLVLTCSCLLCLTYLNQRIRAVEIVS